MPRLVDKPGFGPRRRLGWGWAPASWQSWIVTAIFLAAIVLCGEFLHGLTKGIVEPVLVVLVIAICALTGVRPDWRR
jgi:hypothetical protein